MGPEDVDFGRTFCAVRGFRRHTHTKRNVHPHACARDSAHRELWNSARALFRILSPSSGCVRVVSCLSQCSFSFYLNDLYRIRFPDSRNFGLEQVLFRSEEAQGHCWNCNPYALYSTQDQNPHLSEGRERGGGGQF